MSASEICQQCGACCGHYRVSFYWGESNPNTGGTVPPDLTEPLTPFRVIMKGTGTRPSRCVALSGEIGASVACTIHTIRASTCREFGVHDVDGRPHIHEADIERCNAARAAWSIPPLDVAMLTVVRDEPPPTTAAASPSAGVNDGAGMASPSQEGFSA